MDKKILELRQKVAELSQSSEPKPTAQTDTKPVTKVSPTTETTTPQVEPKILPVPEKTNELGLTPDEIRMFKEMMAQKNTPQETKVEEAPVQVEETIPDPNIQPEPTQEELETMNRERLEQLQMEVTRLQNNGVYRAEVLYQLVNLNANLERIGIAIEETA